MARFVALYMSIVLQKHIEGRGRDVQDTVKVIRAELCLGEGEESDEEVVPEEGLRWWVWWMRRWRSRWWQ
jgi:hypothetical protein